MVDQVGADARTVEPRAQKDGRRVDGPGRHHDAVGVELLAADDHARGPATVNDGAVDETVAPNAEVGPRSRSLQVCLVGGDPSPLAQRQPKRRHTGDGNVVVGYERVTQTARGAGES